VVADRGGDEGVGGAALNNRYLSISVLTKSL
jgi:hypothetical protein